MQVTVPRLDRLSQFKEKKYLGLETFRRNGESVFTPVWFVTDNTHLYVITDPNSGKAKRIRNNPNVQVVPVTSRNKPDGEWIEGEARIVNNPTPAQIKQFMDAKYGWFDKAMARLYSLITRHRPTNSPIVIRIRV